MKKLGLLLMLVICSSFVFADDEETSCKDGSSCSEQSAEVKQGTATEQRKYKLRTKPKAKQAIKK